MLTRLMGRLDQALDSKSERVKFAFWGTGVLAVFFFHVAALLDAAVGGEHGALIWSILLLIAAPVSVVGLIAVGFVRSGGPGGDAADGRGSESNADS